MHKRCGKTIGSAVIFFYIIAFVITPQSAFAINYICGQDLNGNNYSGDTGEIQSCITTSQGNFCPVGAVGCSLGLNGTPTCPEGSVYNGVLNKCESNPVCPNGSSFNASTSKCEIASTTLYNCPSDNQNYDDLSTCNSSCTQQVSCTGNTAWIYSGAVAPPETSGWWGSFNWIIGSSNTCFQQSGANEWMCDMGNENYTGPYSSEGECQAVCHTHIFYMYDICNTGTDNLYFHRSGCGNQTYNLSRGQCVNESASIPGCGSDSVWLSAINYTCPLSGGSACSGSPLQCTGPASCNAVSSCPTGYTNTDGVCSADPSCNTGFTYDASSKKCAANATCNITGTCAFESISAKYICSLNSTPYDTSTDCTNNCVSAGACTAAYTCPLGSSYACMENIGTMQCSPNTCVDDDNPANTTTTDDPLETLTDDGAKDAEGRCLGTVYFFNGTAMGCNKSGKRTSWKNCCSTDKASDSVQDNAGTTNEMYRAYSAVKTLQEIYQYTQMLQAANAIDSGTAVVGTIYEGAQPVGLMVNGTSFTGQSGQVMIQSYQVAQAGGSATANAASSIAASCAWAIVIAVIVMIIVDLISQGCSAKDIITDTMKYSGTCHYIGDMCTSTMELMGCVQKTEKYCCFNTKLARIIHEQGRPQLKSFGPDGGWGTPELPNCRGFLAEEFQMLDFSKMDLSEYYEDIKSKVSKNVQQNVGDRVQQYYDKTTK